MITPNQIRYIDPFSDISSQAVNNRLKAIFGSRSKACLYGLELSHSNNVLTISRGIALKDYVVLEFPDDIQIEVTDVGTFHVVIHYQYQVSETAPVAEVGYISEDVYLNNQDLYVIIGTITCDGSNITSISYEHRDRNPINDFVMQYFQSGMMSDLNMNHHRIINLADPEEDLDAVNKEYVENQIGKVKINSTDQAGYLEEKFKNGENTEITVDNANPNDLKLLISAQDQYIRVDAADSSNQFLNSEQLKSRK